MRGDGLEEKLRAGLVVDGDEGEGGVVFVGKAGGAAAGDVSSADSAALGDVVAVAGHGCLHAVAAGDLTELAAKVEPKGIKVGSYPRWGKKKNVVTLVGTDREYMDSLIDEVAKGVDGKRVQSESEDDTDGEEEVKLDKDA